MTPPVLRGPRADYTVPGGLPGLVRRHAVARPSAPACVADGVTLSFRDLDGAADAVAARLRSTPEHAVVALYLPRGPEMTVAMLGCLRAGRPFLPIALGEPTRRLTTMLALAAPAAVLTVPGLDLPSPLAALTRVDVGASGDPLPDAPTDLDAPAYVLFTSGSTGVPKGVRVSHRALLNRLMWAQETFRLGPDDVVLHKTPYTFDVALWELLWPATAGAVTSYLPPDAHTDPGAVVEAVVRDGITLCHFIPTMLEEFLAWPGAARCTSLRDVLCSGEALLPHQVRRFGETLPARLHNLYGPTEAAIDVTHWPVPDPLTCQRVFIGAPVSNTDLYVLDGELCLAGVQLADGYLDEEQTARAFRHLDDGVRIYRTGDRARVVDGLVELLGRLDDQVKIRGVRVEPREAELAIADHPAVRGVGVVAADTGAGRELVAFVVATPPADQTVWRDPELTASVLAHARMSLTGAHVPTTVYGINRLPLSRNGKLDRRRLADLAAELAGREDAADPDDIAAVWRAATGSDAADVGFLDLGGTSVGAARVAAAVLRATGSRMPLRWLLTDNLGLGDLLRRTSAPATTAAVTTDGALSAGQRMLWFLRELHGSLSAYNVVSAVRVAGPVPTLAERLAEIVAGQDELRTRFVTDEDGQPRREVLPTVELPLTTVAGETDQLLTSLQEHDFKPDEAPLFRVVVLPHGTTTTVVFAASHLIADQYSAEIIWSHLLDGVPVTGAVAAPRPPDAAEVASALAYWRGALDGAPPHLNLPFRRALDTVPSFAGHSAVRALPAEYRRDSAALLAAFAAVLSSWTGDPDVVVGMAYDGRRGRDDANWIGFGVDSLPIRVTVDPAAAMDDLTLTVRQRIRDAAKHSAARVDDIVAALAVPRTMDRSPLFQAWFNDLSTIEQPLAADRPRVPQPPALFDVGLYVYGRADGGLDLQITCAADLFDAAVAEHLADGLLATVTAPPGAVSAMLPRGEAPAAVAAGPTADLATLLDRFHTVGDNDAVAIGDVTYGDLRAQVASAAAVIAGHDNLAVLATPSPWLVVALLACWSAGVSPLVVDGDLPAGYLDGILRDAGVTATIGEDLSVLGQQSTLARPRADVAHRLTTSGSTGAPAVITVPATAFATALLRHAEEFDLGPDDRFAVLSGAGHDPVFREAVLPLLIGARTFFPAEHERADVTALARALDRERVTVLYLTPPRGELLAAAAEADHTTLHHVRLVVFGGSVLEWRTVDRIRALCPNARVANGYGLTEVSQLASAYHCGTASDGTVPIGYGASGRRLVLLRDGHAAAVGQLGRIAVAEPYPVGLRDGVALGGPLVLTGDTGRIGLDGELRWCGRADRQISVDGHRVEPHEVERRLLAEPEVRTATVGVHGAMLVAQIVPTTAVPGLGEQLKDRLRAVLPAWLVPDRIDVVDRLAVNRNGKPALDPAAAPAPPPTADRSLADIVRAHLPDGAVLTGQTTFFEAGLDSHALVRVVRDLQRSGYPTVRLVDLFRWPNVTALTAGLAARQQPAPPVERASGLRSHADRRRHLRAALRAPTQGGPQRG